MAYGAPAFVDFVQDLAEPLVTAAPDVTPLANGGFAVIGERNGNINLGIYNSGGTLVRTVTHIDGVDGAVTQLSDGNLAIVSEVGGSSVYTVIDPATGAIVTDAAASALPTAVDGDITALQGGGFAVALAFPVGGESDLYIELRENDGSLRGFIVVNTTIQNDGDVSITTLDNGNLALAWTRTDGVGNTKVMYAVYQPNGAIVVPETPVAHSDTEIMRNPSISAANGGFAIAFESRLAPSFSPPSSVDILLKTYDFDGVQQLTLPITNAQLFQTSEDDGSNDSDPYLQRAPDGNLVVGYVTETGGATFDVVKGGASIASVVIGGSSPAVTFFGTGQVAAFAIDGGALFGQHYFGNRDGSGDGANDAAVGDDFFDIMNGGDGNDTLSGGRNNDEVKGDDGADLLHGDEGDDTVNGGGDTGDDTGADRLFGDDGNDLILGDGGADTLFGGDGADSLFGDGEGDLLRGGQGNDTLEGGAGVDDLDGEGGVDVMRGGNGNDTYRVDRQADQTIETTGGATGGTDTVNSLVNRTLGANLENLNLLGAANTSGTGNEAANVIAGNTGANSLSGLGGNDTLSGGDGADDLRGGEGDDSMAGGAGSDRYFVDSAGDVVNESGGAGLTGGNDTVFSQISYTLGADVEILRLQGAGGLSGTGNELGNRISGTTGANLLSGLGGADVLEGNDGADTLAGGAGNDTLTGGSQADVFRFTMTNAGADTITDFNKNADRFDLGGGSFSAVITAPDGDVILTHNGGTIRIDAPLHNLTLAQYNALVLPSGGGGLHVAAPDLDLMQFNGDWVFA